MKSILQLSILAALVSSALTACKSSGLRDPSSIKNNFDINFDLINDPQLLKNDYDFELLSLYDLPQGKLVLKKQGINLLDSKKALSDWHGQLKGFIAVNQQDFSFNKNVPVTSDELSRLDRALDFLLRTGENPEVIFRQQVEIITAFNEKFKASTALNRDAAIIPINLVKTTSEKIEVLSSSFKSGLRDNLKVSDFRRPGSEAEDKMADVCSFENSKTLLCQHFKFNFVLGPAAKAASFNSKFYYYLGYYVPRIEFRTGLKVRYNKEFMIQAAREKAEIVAHLNDGELLKDSDLYRKLWPYCKADNRDCFEQATLYDQRAENDIQYLEVKNLALVENNGDHVFGPWSAEDLDHSTRPEIKALLIVGAFTGNYDLRKENNSLIWSSKNFDIEHQITNLNTGFGRTTPGSSFNVASMPWEVFKRKFVKGKEVIVVDDFSPVLKHQVLAQLSFSEGQWIVRQIAQINDNEITKALQDSGFKDFELTLAREKLLSIQKNMVDVFDLKNEFPEISSRIINKNLKKTVTNQKREQSRPYKSATTSEHS